MDRHWPGFGFRMLLTRQRDRRRLIMAEPKQDPDVKELFAAIREMILFGQNNRERIQAQATNAERAMLSELIEWLRPSKSQPKSK